MTAGPVAPSFPFGKWFRTPAAPRTRREQCRYCLGGGEINGCPCPGDCDGRGWVTIASPAPKET